MEIKLDEVQHFGVVSMILSIVAFLVFVCWDPIAGVQIQHSSSYGWMQIVAMSITGLYSMWAYSIHLKWKEYREQIHELME